MARGVELIKSDGAEIVFPGRNIIRVDIYIGIELNLFSIFIQKNIHEIIYLVHDVGIENRKQLDVILLDFSKSFDKVPHRCLLLNSTTTG